MKEPIYKDRFVKCPKYRFNFYITETYVPLRSSDAYKLFELTPCPALEPNNGYIRHRCDGIDVNGRPCSFSLRKPIHPDHLYARSDIE